LKSDPSEVEKKSSHVKSQKIYYRVVLNSVSLKVSEVYGVLHSICIQGWMTD